MIIQAFIRIISFLLLICFADVSLCSDVVVKNDEDSVRIIFQPTGDEKIYWHSSGANSLPTVINVSGDDNLKSYYINWPWPSISKFNSALQAYYGKDTIIEIDLIPNDPSKPIKYTLDISYLLCNQDGCFQKSLNFSGQVYGSNQSRSISNININKVERFSDNVSITIGNYSSAYELTDFILTKNNIIYIPEKISKHDDNLVLSFKIDEDDTEMNYDLYIDGERNSYPIHLRNASSGEVLYLILVFALLGGAILNFMPCVLPVLSIKLFGFAKLENYSDRRIFATLSIITILTYFWALALAVVITRAAGGIFLTGFSFQKPEYLIFFIVVLTFMLAVIREKLNISFGINVQAHNKSKYISSILTTLVSTALATPCTAPFLATSMAYGLTQPPQIIFLIFTFVAIGFAFPYFAAIIFPNLYEFMPKSGPWQRRLKVVMEVLLVGTIIWLIFLLYSFLGIYSVLVTIFIVYLMRFVLESTFSTRKKIISTFCIIIAIFSVPFTVSSDFKKQDVLIRSYWQKYDAKQVESLISEGKPVIINITADWCVSCQVNKFFVLDTIKVIKLLKAHQVYAFTADITKPDQEIYGYMNKNNVSGIPYTVIYGLNGRKALVLPVIINYKDVETAILSQTK